jgi:hypothetical protein
MDLKLILGVWRILPKANGTGEVIGYGRHVGWEPDVLERIQKKIRLLRALLAISEKEEL